MHVSLRDLTSAVLVFLAYQSANGQPVTGAPSSAQQPISLSAVGRGASWRHIGAPPSSGSPGARAENWGAERASFHEAFGVIKESWTGEAVDTPSELRSKVGQYEDLIRTVTDSGGYGNLVLADTLRRLSSGLLGRYVTGHPSDYAVVGEILETNRIRLLDSPAVGGMLMEELGLAPPSGKWHLSESWDDLQAVASADGSSLRTLSSDMLISPRPSSLVAKRDVTGLLSRLIAADGVDRMVLAGLIEFLRQSGQITDLRSFDRLMEKQKARFRFPPFGTGTTLGAGNIVGLLNMYRPWEGKTMPFSALVVGE
jgi:hypothetical protein